MADKSFALKVELQGDVEQFKRNMEKAKSYSAGMAKGVEKAGAKAKKGFGGMTGGASKLQGAMAAAGGGQGVGLLSQALSSLSSPAGMATAAIAAIAMGIRQARADMEKFEMTTDALTIGIGAFMESARKMRKEEKQALRGGRLSTWREIARLQRELTGFRKDLKNAESSGDTERAARLTADIEAHRKLIKEKEKLDQGFAQKRSDLGNIFGGKRDAKEEFAAANHELQIANRDAVVAKREQKRIEREIMELSAVMAVNSDYTNEQRLEAVNRTKQLRSELMDQAAIQQTQIDAQKTLNALGMNTLDDEAKVTALMTEREKLLKKMVTSQKEIDNTLVRISKEEEKVTAEKAKQMMYATDMEKIAQRRKQGAQVRASGGDSTAITYAGAGVFQGEGYSSKMEDWYERQKFMLEDLNQMAESFVAGSLADMAAGFGEALSTGDMEGFTQGVLRSFGQFLVQMGGMLIAYGISMDAFKKAFSNPFAAIAAGVALTAIGGAIMGSVSSFNKSGSSSGGGGYAASGYSAAGGGVVTFELEGDKLKGAIRNSDRKTNNFR